MHEMRCNNRAWNDIIGFKYYLCESFFLATTGVHCTYSVVERSVNYFFWKYQHLLLCVFVFFPQYTLSLTEFVVNIMTYGANYFRAMRFSALPTNVVRLSTSCDYVVRLLSRNFRAQRLIFCVFFEVFATCSKIKQMLCTLLCITHCAE